MRTFVTFISLLLFVNIYGQKENDSWCQWHKNGSADLKMPDNSYGYFKKGNFLYYLSNDNDNIYIDIKIEDSGIQNKILQEGLNVWINPNGKSVKKTGLRFPIGAKYAGIKRMKDSGNIKTGSPFSMANTIELIGFPESKPKLIPSGSADGISGSVKYDNDGVLFYNMKIPLSELDLKAEKSGTGVVPFSLGIEYGAAPESGEAQTIRRPADTETAVVPSSGGRGGRGGGGRSGGGAAGGAMPKPSVSAAQTAETSIVLWLKDISLTKAN